MVAAAVYRSTRLEKLCGCAALCRSASSHSKRDWKASSIQERMKRVVQAESMNVNSVLGGACILGRPVGLLAMNQYLIFCQDTKEAAIIDSGTDDMPDFLDVIAKEKLKVKYLLQTHGHPDHVAGLASTKKHFPAAKIALHSADIPIAQCAPLLGQAFGMSIAKPPPPDILIEDNQEFKLGKLSFRALHTPGHCPGHICFYEEERNILFSGDLLFKGTVGRTDLPSSDPEDMKKSLARIAREIQPSTEIFPGHMDQTIMSSELRTNPFLYQYSKQKL
eukprot:gene10360-2495_t